MSTAIENFYKTLPLDKVANNAKEFNTHSTYYWMLNKYGLKVPVGEALVQDMLPLGFTHTDRVVYTKETTEKGEVRKAKVSEKRQLADAIEKLAAATAPKVEPKEAKKEPKRNLQFVKRETLEAQATEKGFTESEISACETKDELDTLIQSR